jgi:hypothetical protein
MNPYVLAGSGIGTNDATSLSARLSAWHDEMVTHERRLRMGRAGDVCDDECAHAEARALWAEAVATFGVRAHQLAFLRSCAHDASRATQHSVAARSDAADRGRPSSRARSAPPPAAASAGDQPLRTCDS